MLAARNKDAPPLYDPALQALSPDALAALRTERLAALLARARAATASCYAGIGGTLTGVPILTAADLADEVDAHPPFGRLQLDAAPLIRAALDADRLDARRSRRRSAARRTRAAAQRVGRPRAQLGHARRRPGGARNAGDLRRTRRARRAGPAGRRRDRSRGTAEGCRGVGGRAAGGVDRGCAVVRLPTARHQLR